MTAGSGLFSTAQARLPHLLASQGGLAGEIVDLRRDILAAMAPLAAIAVEEFINPVGIIAGATNSLHAATATVAAPVTVLKAALTSAGLVQMGLWPRQVSFTTAGSDPTHGPATATVTGLDKDGAALVEVVTLSQTATTDFSAGFFSDITSVLFATAGGTDATIAIGYAATKLQAATASVTSAVTTLGADLVQTDLALHPRQLIFTTAGGTASDVPATATIIGRDINSNVITEVVTLAQTATTATSVNAYASVTSIAYPAGQGTGGTIAISPAAAIGLRNTLKARTGAVFLIKELAAGSVVTNGVLSTSASVGPYGAYAPNTVADGINDYAIYYEYDASA